MLHLKFKLRFTLTVLFLLAPLLFLAYPLCAQSVERKVRVAARICPPFVMNDTIDLGLSQPVGRIFDHQNIKGSIIRQGRLQL